VSVRSAVQAISQTPVPMDRTGVAGRGGMDNETADMH
jgi:hypothetical protein